MHLAGVGGRLGGGALPGSARRRLGLGVVALLSAIGVALGAPAAPGVAAAVSLPPVSPSPPPWPTPAVAPSSSPPVRAP